MSFPFQSMQLRAPSLYALLAVPAAMRLFVDEQQAFIRGDGYPQEVAAAFSALVLDWEATISCAAFDLGLQPGAYDLIFVDGQLYACANDHRQLLADRPVRVAVVEEE